MAARPRTPAPTTGAAVLTPKALDEDDDPPAFPVATPPLVVGAPELLLAVVVVLPACATGLMKFAQATAARQASVMIQFEYDEVVVIEKMSSIGSA